MRVDGFQRKKHDGMMLVTRIIVTMKSLLWSVISIVLFKAPHGWDNCFVSFALSLSSSRFWLVAIIGGEGELYVDNDKTGS